MHEDCGRLAKQWYSLQFGNWVRQIGNVTSSAHRLLRYASGCEGLFVSPPKSLACNCVLLVTLDEMSCVKIVDRMVHSHPL